MKPLFNKNQFSTTLMLLLTAAITTLSVLAVRAEAALTTFYSFHVFPNGANPLAGLSQGTDGNFYGTTTAGGTNGGYGTVYRISTNGVPTSLYSFTGGNDGAQTYGPLVQGGDGYFYGTTTLGGSNRYYTASGYVGYGTIFRISTNGTLHICMLSTEMMELFPMGWCWVKTAVFMELLSSAVPTGMAPFFQ